jgi:hypothetical protein
MIRKNKKFIDPRYFMDEKMEDLNEALPPTEFSDEEIAHQRSAIADMDVGITREFAQDVVEYVRREIIPEQAPAMAGMSISDFLRLAADMAGDEPMAVDRWRNK